MTQIPGSMRSTKAIARKSEQNQGEGATATVPTTKATKDVVQLQGGLGTGTQENNTVNKANMNPTTRDSTPTTTRQQTTTRRGRIVSRPLRYED